MKKLCIAFAAIGLVLLIAGIIISGIYTSMGYSVDLDDIGLNRSRSDSVQDTQVTETSIAVESSDSVSTTDDSYYHSYPYSTEINGIKIDVSAADVYVDYSDYFSVSASGVETQKFDESVDENGILKINYENNDIINLSQYLDYEIPSINITLPSNELDSVKINMSTGSVSVYGLNAQTLDVELTAGNISLSGINIAESAKVQTTAGSTSIYESAISNLDLDKTAGDLYVEGSVLTDTIKISNTAGDCSINLSGNIDDYSFNVSKAAGDLNINNNSSIPVNEDAPNKFVISLIAGDIYINIE